MNFILLRFLRALFFCVWIVLFTFRLEAQLYPPAPLLKDGTAVLLQDFASAPLSSRTPDSFNYAIYPPPVVFSDQLARINFLRSEPANAPLAASRFFVCDLNRNLYVLNRTNKTFSVYLDFEATFPLFDNNPGYAGGLISFLFDPEYATNGIFYTIHMENPKKGTAGNDPINPNAVLPSGYVATGVINPPVGTISRQSVLVEWHDTNINNNTFEGTARELLRLGFLDRIHPMGDLIFNPLAQPGDPDYRNLYLAVGDGGAGESTSNDDGVTGLTGGDRHYFPQRLDMLLGKILRITPDLTLRTGTSVLSSNGQYRIPSSGPDPNPFVNTNGARGEIYTYGHRNPHRFAWDPVSNALIIFEIGLTSFEEINVLHKGENYGYAEREGTRKLTPQSGSYGGKPPGYGLSDLPVPDLLPLRIGTNATATLVPVRYPAAEYFQDEGDAISCGFIYRGNLMPRLNGKCVFGDITTGRLFYSDLNEMISCDDTNPATLAVIHELQPVYNSSTNQPGQPPIERRMFDIVADEFQIRGGTNASGARLPGGADVTGGNDPDGVPYGNGRADIRIAQGGDGELYLLSKSDGVIRQFTAVVAPPMILSATATNSSLKLVWQSISGKNYRVQYSGSLNDTNWTDLPGDVAAVDSTASKTNTLSSTNRFFRIKVLP